MTLPTPLNEFLFGIYPYLCCTIWLLGSLIRFDRDPYSWKSDSSQLLRLRTLRIGSNLFHYGVGVVLIGHIVGFLLPETLLLMLVTPTQHQLMAMVTGGLAGVVAITGLTLLIYRRLGDARVRNNSRTWDFAVVFMLWFQLALGLGTIWWSAKDLSGAGFEHIVSYVQSIAYFRGGAAGILQGTAAVYQLHILLGFTLLLISPFTRLAHIWSGVASVAYLFRPYQLVRKRGAVERS